MPKIERICQQCRKSFQAESWEIKQGKGKYCSKECAQISRNKSRIGSIPWNKGLTKETSIIIQKCAEKQSGKNCHLPKIPWNKGKKGCCSIETRKKMRESRLRHPECGFQPGHIGYSNKNMQAWVKLKCKICGEQYEILLSQKDKRGEYCSLGCYWESLLGKEPWNRGTGDPHYFGKMKESRITLEGEKGEAYLKTLIIGRNRNLRHADIPPELVELKRAQLKLTREVKRERESNIG